MVAGARKARMDEVGAGFLSPDDVAAAVESLLIEGDGGTVQYVHAGHPPQTVRVQRLDPA
jgi:hypothetical protein